MFLYFKPSLGSLTRANWSPLASNSKTAGDGSLWSDFVIFALASGDRGAAPLAKGGAQIVPASAAHRRRLRGIGIALVPGGQANCR
jgi:hypothetical protein